MNNVDLRSQPFGGGDIPQVVLDMLARSTTERQSNGEQNQTLAPTGPVAEMFTGYGITEQSLVQYIDSLQLAWPDVAARNPSAELQRAANPHSKPRRLLGYAGEVIPPQIAAVIFRNAVGLAGGPVAAAVTGMITGTWAGWRETRQLKVSGKGVGDLYARNVSSLEKEGRAAAERGGLGGVLASTFNKFKAATTFLSRRSMEDALGVKSRQQEIRQLLYYANIDLAADGTIARKDRVNQSLRGLNDRSLESLLRHLMTQGVLSGFAEESSPAAIRALSDILVLAVIEANERGPAGVRIIHNATLTTQQDINEHSAALKHGVYKYVRGAERALMAASGSVLVGMALDSLGLSHVPDSAQSTTQTVSSTRGAAGAASGVVTDQLTSVDDSLVQFTNTSQQISGNTKNILLEAAKRQGFGSVEEYLNNAGPEFAARWERIVDFADFAAQYKSNPAIKTAVETIARNGNMSVIDVWDRLVFHAQYIGDNPGQMPQFMKGDLVDLQKFTEAVSNGEYVLPSYVDTVDQAWHELAKNSLESNLFSTVSGSFEINTTPVLDAVGVFLRGLSKEQVEQVIAGTSTEAEAVAAIAEAATIFLGGVFTAADIHNAVANKTVVYGGRVNIPAPQPMGQVPPLGYNPVAPAPAPAPAPVIAPPVNPDIPFDEFNMSGQPVISLGPDSVQPVLDDPNFAEIPNTPGLTYETSMTTDGVLSGNVFVNIHKVKNAQGWDRTKFYLTLSNGEAYLFDTNNNDLQKIGQQVQFILTNYGKYKVEYESDKLKFTPQIEEVYNGKDGIRAIFDNLELLGDIKIFAYHLLDNANHYIPGAKYLKIEQMPPSATLESVEVLAIANALFVRYPEVLGESGWKDVGQVGLAYGNNRIKLDKQTGEIKFEEGPAGVNSGVAAVKLGIPLQSNSDRYDLEILEMDAPMDYPDSGSDHDDEDLDFTPDTAEEEADTFEEDGEEDNDDEEDDDELITDPALLKLRTENAAYAAEELKSSVEGFMKELTQDEREAVFDEIAITGRIDAGVEMIMSNKQDEIEKLVPKGGADRTELEKQIKHDLDGLLNVSTSGEAIDASGNPKNEWRKQRMSHIVTRELGTITLALKDAEFPEAKRLTQVPNFHFGLSNRGAEKLVDEIDSLARDELGKYPPVKDSFEKIKRTCKAYLETVGNPGHSVTRVPAENLLRRGEPTSDEGRLNQFDNAMTFPSVGLPKPEGEMSREVPSSLGLGADDLFGFDDDDDYFRDDEDDEEGFDGDDYDIEHEQGTRVSILERLFGSGERIPRQTIESRVNEFFDSYDNKQKLKDLIVIYGEKKKKKIRDETYWRFAYGDQYDWFTRIKVKSQINRTIGTILRENPELKDRSARIESLGKYILDNRDSLRFLEIEIQDSEIKKDLDIIFDPRFSEARSVANMFAFVWEAILKRKDNWAVSIARNSLIEKYYDACAAYLDLVKE